MITTAENLSTGIYTVILLSENSRLVIRGRELIGRTTMHKLREKLDKYPSVLGVYEILL